MWAGTNSGSVFAYALEVPPPAGGEKRPERAVEAVLGKEVQLMHRAPVVAIAVLDGRGRPLPEPYEASRDLAQAPDMQGGHAVLIASEEQFKVSTRGDHPGSRAHAAGPSRDCPACTRCLLRPPETPLASTELHWPAAAPQDPPASLGPRQGALSAPRGSAGGRA